MDLFIFDNIANDPCVKGLLEKNDKDVLKNIIRFAETEGVTTDSIREYMASCLANDDNILSSLAQSGKKIGNDLYKLSLMDMEQIYKKLFSIPIKYSPSENDTGFSEEYVNSIREMTESKSAKDLLEKLIRHYRSLGSGVLSRYIAFKYDGELHGIANTDKTTFDSLVGLEHQKKVLIENTEAFVRGNPANNVLLFGDRGTGKSSSVKALLNMFSSEGLRVIELPKSCIKDIPYLTEKLADKPNKYILFLDDLSFESRDAEYKALKTSMEGQLQAHPENVLIYATSNRRHLIRETYEDRQGGEMHVNDNMQETLSLAERFGISLVFSAPNQKEYLHIAEELLKAHGIEMTPELEKQAVVWQMNYGGKSARCAKQFAASCAAKKKKGRISE